MGLNDELPTDTKARLDLAWLEPLQEIAWLIALPDTVIA